MVTKEKVKYLSSPIKRPSLFGGGLCYNLSNIVHGQKLKSLRYLICIFSQNPHFPVVTA